MNASVWVDGKKLFLNPFITVLIGNVMDAVARSLKTPEGKQVEFLIRGEELQLMVDQRDVPLNLGHAQQIVGNLFHGIRRSLKGAESGTEFRFIYER